MSGKLRKTKIRNREQFKRIAPCFLFGDAKKGTGHPLVKQQGQQGNAEALDQIQRRYCKEYKSGYGVYVAIDGSTHGNDGIQRQFK